MQKGGWKAPTPPGSWLKLTGNGADDKSRSRRDDHEKRKNTRGRDPVELLRKRLSRKERGKRIQKKEQGGEKLKKR